MIAFVRNWLGRTLTRKFTLLLAGFLALQTLQLGVGIFGVLHIGEEGAAINEAGRQRYRTVMLGTLARGAMAAGAWSAEQRALYSATLTDYERYFTSFSARLARSRTRAQATPIIEEARAYWEDELKPLLADFDPARYEASRPVLRRYEALAPIQVARLDRVVTLIEKDAVEDARALALFQVILLGLTLLLGLVGVWLARRQVGQPLRRFIEATEEIAAGAYDRRVTIASRDELGELGENFNRMAGAVEARTSQLSALNQVAIAITSSSSLKDTLNEIMRRGMLLTGAQAACIAFYDQETNRFKEWVTQGLSEHFVKNMSFRPGGLADEAFTTTTTTTTTTAVGTYILSNDQPQTKHKLSKLTHDEGIRCFICLPLTSHANRLGVIYFYRTDRDSFTPAEIELLTTFARLAAEAIENRRLHEHLAGEARTDALTGLYNRREFDARLADEHQRARRYAKPFAVLMIDIDHFKRVNDDYGHPAGDAVLKALAGIFKKQFRDVDIIARYGGEEFTVILPEISGGAAKPVAERVRRAVAATPFQLPDGREIGITVSIGVSCFPNCADNPRQVLESADQALYVAKEAGRNRVLLYRETLKARIEQDPGCIVALLNESLDNVRPIVTAVSAKGVFFRKHTDLVEQAALQLAQSLRLSADDTKALKLASRLHDIGMAAVPDAILNKTAKLTEEEWAQVRRHSAIAADWLEQVPALKHLAPLVRHHHERFDGSGYPDGLKGEDTPYLARVLATADAYGSMTSDLGHKGMKPEEAMAELRAGAGTQFDPEIVAALLRAIESGAE
ncbi:MAG: diguanylate cyclase [Pseudomonadota bacterium]